MDPLPATAAAAARRGTPCARTSAPLARPSKTNRDTVNSALWVWSAISSMERCPSMWGTMSLSALREALEIEGAGDHRDDRRVRNPVPDAFPLVVAVQPLEDDARQVE
jgi:hypothetical protein